MPEVELIEDTTDIEARRIVWRLTPAQADLLGITRDMADHDGWCEHPEGVMVLVPDWAEPDGA